MPPEHQGPALLQVQILLILRKKSNRRLDQKQLEHTSGHYLATHYLHHAKPALGLLLGQSVPHQ